ncbi:MAG: RNA polymerase sigma factor [Myxococcaceae bacterium]
MRRDEIEALYRKYGSLAQRRAQAILGEPEAARDVVQEVFVNVLRAPDAFRQEASPTTWLYQAVTHVCLRRLRDGGRRAQLLDLNAPKEEPRTAEGAGDEALTLAAILRRVPEALRAGETHRFSETVALDDVAGVEQVLAVFCASPISVETAAEAVRKTGNAPPNCDSVRRSFKKTR